MKFANRLGIVTLALMVSCACFAPQAQAGGGPENVAVVINSDSWASQAVANEFIQLRHIPPANVIYLSLGEVGDFSTVDVNVFRSKVLMPALLALRERGLNGQIDYLIYSTDLPNAVNFNPDLGDRPNNLATASATGLTYMYQRVLKKDAEYASLSVNRYVRNALDVDFTGVMHKRLLMAVQQMMEEGKYDGAEKMLSEMLKKRARNPELLYVHACVLARLEKPDDALKELSKAVDSGFSEDARMAASEDLKSIAFKEAFKALLTKMKEAATKPSRIKKGEDNTTNTQETKGFRGVSAWTQRGEIDPTGQGDLYLLSTMLAWTSGRGNSVAEAINCLRRSASADGTCPKGTIYYIVNTDIRSLTRKNGFASAIARLKELGVKAEIYEAKNVNDLPDETDDIAGMMAGSADFGFPARSKITPGAICEHLTSFGGNLNEGCGQTPLTAWISAGASGSSGTVTEPFALQQKFPLPFIHVHYAKGCTLAEAFYQSVMGPYQLLIVGDPLCRPWAIIPAVQVAGVKDGDTVKGSLTLTPSVKDSKATPVGEWQLFVDGKRIMTVMKDEKLGLDTTELGDGYHDIRVVAVTSDPIQTQGEAILGIVVKNSGLGGTCQVLGTGKVTYGQVARVQAKVAKAKKLVLMNNGRQIGSVDGDNGTFQVDSRLLGTGTVTLQAVGLLSDKAGAKDRVYCQPVELPVDLPLAFEPVKVTETTLITGGVLTGLPSGTVAIMADKAEPDPAKKDPEKEKKKDLYKDRIRTDWLTKWKAVPNQKLQLDGYVSAKEDDMHQFQVLTDGTYEITLDGRKLVPTSQEKGWQFLPVNLKAGWHHVSISFTTGPKLVMEVRFGNKGVISLQESNFRHLPG